MTIRRNVDIAAANTIYGNFLDGVEEAKAGVLPQAQNIADLIGDAADEILRTAKELGLNTCNCDGIREIEVLIFDMLRRRNPDSEIDQAIALGQTECAR